MAKNPYDYTHVYGTSDTKYLKTTVLWGEIGSINRLYKYDPENCCSIGDPLSRDVLIDLFYEGLVILCEGQLVKPFAMEGEKNSSVKIRTMYVGYGAPDSASPAPLVFYSSEYTG